MVIDEEEMECFEILNYFDDSYQEYWRQQMLRTDWPGAAELEEMLRMNQFFEKLGENAKLIMLTDGETLISYCAANADGEVKYLFTFPSYRGNGCAKKLIDNL